MATPPNYTTANTDSTNNETTLEADSLAIFVSEATEIINNNISLGLFQCFLDVPESVVVSQAMDYFTNLGYYVNILTPEVNLQDFNQQFFGQIAGLDIPPIQQPQMLTRLIISWSSNPPNSP